MIRSLTEPGQFVHNHLFTVSAYDLYSAMVAANALGLEHKALREQ